MDQMPVMRETVLRRIGQHRRHDDAVAQAHAAQIDRREKQAVHECPPVACLIVFVVSLSARR